MSQLTGPLVVAADLIVTPVKELPPEIRGRLTADAGGVAVSRPFSRTPSKILDADGAALLDKFRTPRRLVEGVFDYSVESATDPEDTLRAAYRFLKEMVESEFLVAPDADGAQAPTPTLARHATVAAFRVVRPVAMLSDTEVYEVERPGSRAALKIGRVQGHASVAGMIRHEARALRRLEGIGAPRLLDQGTLEGRQFLIETWHGGIHPDAAAAEFRGDPSAAQGHNLLTLFRELASAYARLHARGVVHGDVHPGNLILGPDGTVTILDFGWSRLAGRRAPGTRGRRAGAPFLLEPEYAGAIRAGKRAPPPTPASDQFSLAALMYRLATGDDYVRFSLYHNEALRQIAEDPPLAFAAQGARSWPGLERVLARALHKDPRQRFDSLDDLGAALERIEPQGVVRPTGRRSSRGRLLSLVLRRLGHSGALFAEFLTPAPHCSVYYGALGTAYGLGRIAKARDDSRIQSLAELWHDAAIARIGSRGAFTNDRLGLTRRTLGRVSGFHTRVGAYLLDALSAGDRGDQSGRNKAIARWLEGAGRPKAGLDLTLGKAGTLLHAALLVEMCREDRTPVPKTLLRYGRRTERELRRRLRRRPPGAVALPDLNLGLAHGWAGLLYAMLRWAGAADSRPSAWHIRGLHRLCDAAELEGETARWPWVALDNRGRVTRATMQGWCNGSAGMVPLLTLAYGMTREERLLDVAQRAGLDCVECRTDEVHLCCGAAGLGYALLSLYRATGDKVWFDRAAAVADRAAELVVGRQADASSDRMQSLFRGELGLAVLVADLERPQEGGLPLFEVGR
jgi:serine/threonine-protein kinase